MFLFSNFQLEIVKRLKFREINEFVYLQAANVSTYAPTFTLFGKALLKTFNFHPDTFVQLALQLAYYKLHGK